MAEELTTAAAIVAAAGVAKPVVETGCRLIENLLGEPTKVAGGMMADGVYAWRWANRAMIATMAKKIMDRNKIAARVVPKGFLLPLIDAAGDVEAPDLQKMWAQLLASGVADDQHQHPAFVKTLERMSGDDARLLRARMNALSNAYPKEWKVPPFTPIDAPVGTFLADSRLVSLGLTKMLPNIGGSMVNLTGFGMQFVVAVMPDAAKGVIEGPEPEGMYEATPDRSVGTARDRRRKGRSAKRGRAGRAES